MNDNPLNDPILQSLEARLAAIPPRLPQREQRELLYQSAFTAGQSAAQRAVAQSARRWMAATTLLALVSLTLGYRVMTLTGATAVDLRKDSFVARREPAASPLRPLPVETNEGDSRQLSVTTSFDRVVDFNWPTQTLAVEKAMVTPASDSPEPALTTMSRISPDIPWN